MKKLVVWLIAVLFTASASFVAFPDVSFAKKSKTGYSYKPVKVKGYTKKDGTRVKSHKRKAPKRSEITLPERVYFAQNSQAPEDSSIKAIKTKQVGR